MNIASDIADRSAGTDENGEDSLKQAATDLGSAAVEVSLQLKRTLDMGKAALAVAAAEHPVALVAGAAGVGFVLGGGLATSLTKTAVKVGGAFLVEAALDALITAHAAPTAAQTDDADLESPPPRPRTAR